MNIDEIITFLKIVELQSISAAANKLYISQSSASNRISHLENSLGVTLIHRAKGIKTISLTAEGEYFLPIAQQWLALYNDVQNLKESNHVQTYKIIGNNIVNTYLLPYIYSDFSNKYKNIMIHSQTEHSTEAYQLVANQLADLAIVFPQHYVPNIISQPLFKEDMVFICHKNSHFASSHLVDDLIDSHEVYARWSSEYETWHQRYFPYSQRFKIVIGSATMFIEFLTETKDWAIVSRMVGDSIHLNKPDFITIDHSDLPSRTAYLLSHKYPKPGTKQINKLFINELVKHLKSNPSITLIENNLEW